MSQLTLDQYPEMVRALAKPGQAILDSLTPFKCDLYHMSDALTIEAGELADAVKRHVIYEKDLDSLHEGQTLIQNIVEELGDLEFYMEHIRQLLNITREQTLAHNINKLGKRYTQGSYSNNSANERADKQPVQIPPVIKDPAVANAQLEERANTGRKFMAGGENTLQGQQYLQSVASADVYLADIANKQLEELYFLSALVDQSDARCKAIEPFKKANGIIGTSATRLDNETRQLIVSYSNGTVFKYMSQGVNQWTFIEMLGEKQNG